MAIDRFEKITRIRTAPRAVLFRSGSDLLGEGHCSRGGLAMTTHPPTPPALCLKCQAKITPQPIIAEVASCR